jgi:hypothetical protein
LEFFLQEQHFAGIFPCGWTAARIWLAMAGPRRAPRPPGSLPAVRCTEPRVCMERRLRCFVGHLQGPPLPPPPSAQPAVHTAAATTNSAVSFTLGDLAQSGNETTFPLPDRHLTILIFVAGDCPVCGEVWPALAAIASGFGSAAGGGCAAHVVSQDAELSAEKSIKRRLMSGVFLPHHSILPFAVLDDSPQLAASLHWRPDVLPALYGRQSYHEGS